jgi:non-specific serine/threonine protein kinase
VYDSEEIPTFGALLKRWRLAAGLTQKRLAERSGVAERTLQDLERGAVQPRRDTVRRLMVVLRPPRLTREQLVAATSAPRRRAPHTEDRVPDDRGLTALHSPRQMSAELTSFVGRGRELAELRRLLETQRLLTLTGPGGCGKTRLALELAALVEPAWPGGVVFVALAALADASMVAARIALTLGLRETAGQSLDRSLVRFIKKRSMLLVLDNFEHLMPAGPLLAELLTACPNLSVVVTSREILHLRGEQVYPVPPLSLPEPDVSAHADERLSRVAQSEAVRLFVDRTRCALPGFRLDAMTSDLVAEICVRLDGLPLALELAAARMRHLSLASLRQRLDHRLQVLTSGPHDLPSRQRTLRAAIGWSYDLLREGEQALFHQLGVFVGGFTLDAAEHVAGDGFWVLGDGGSGAGHSSPNTQHPTPNTLDGVASLVEKSLIYVVEGVGGESRYAMLETIREYALERLAAAGEEAVLRCRHRDWFLALAERAASELAGPQQVYWLDVLEAEHDNLRAALRWSLHEANIEAGLRFGAALWRFWEGRNHLFEGRAWLNQVLALAGDAADPGLACRALFAAGRMAFLQGDGEAALRFLEPCLTRARELGDPELVASALSLLGHVSRDGGDLSRARSHYDAAFQIWRDRADTRGIARAFLALGRLALIEGSLDEGLELLEESLRQYREVGDLTDITRVLLLLGGAACDLGRLDEAHARYVEGLRIAADLRDRGRMAANLEGCAILAAARAQPERAILLAAMATTISATTGTVLAVDEQRRLTAMLSPIRRALGASRCAELAEQARRMTVDDAITYALADERAESARISQPDRQDTPRVKLTPREQQIVALIGHGLTNEQIAATLVLSKRTVEWHVGNLIGKLGATTRVQLATWASRHDLLGSRDLTAT